MKSISSMIKTLLYIAMWGSIQTAVSQTLITEGPAPFVGGQSEVTNANQVGAVNALAAHPTDPNVLYIGTVNGGVWVTNNATEASFNPTWTPLTDQQKSLSIQALAFDPTDGTHQTLVAGIGRSSSFGRFGGARSGLLRTTDGGANWTVLSGMAGSNVSGVVPRGQVIVVSADDDDSGTSCAGTGIFRSTDSGTTFVQVTNGITGGSVDALASDPSDPNILYASIVLATSNCSGASGIYKSTDMGASWSKISDAAMDATLSESTNAHAEIAVGANNNVFVGTAANGQLTGVFYSDDGGANFVSMDLPGTFEPNFFGIHPGSQASFHMSLVVDPVTDHIVYIGGDRQPGGNNDGTTGPLVFPNSIGAVTTSGRLFRGDATQTSGNQWQPLTHVGTANNTAPHADSRDLMFSANGTLLESDDGGVYVRTTPIDTTGDWFSLNGNMQTTEVHSADYDDNADVLGGGAQDNSQGNQLGTGLPQWNVLLGGDGGDFDVDTVSLAGAGQSIRYTSAQNLLVFLRAIFNSDNSFDSFTLPTLTVVSGEPNPSAQFVTPVDINSENPDRMVFGFNNAVYESFDQGTTLSELTPPIQAFGLGFNCMVAGAPGNEEFLYVAAGSDLYRRTTANTDLLSVFTSNNTIVAVSQHPEDVNHAAFVELFGGVFVTNDAGDNWLDVSGNLPGFDPGRLLSVLYANNPFNQGDALLVGTDRGVYIAHQASGFMVWNKLLMDLPNAPVFGLRYDQVINELFINTMGRGTFSYQPLFEFVDLIFEDGFEDS